MLWVRLVQTLMVFPPSLESVNYDILHLETDDCVFFNDNSHKSILYSRLVGAPCEREGGLRSPKKVHIATQTGIGLQSFLKTVLINLFD